MDELSNRDIVVRLALQVMVFKGWIDPECVDEDDQDDELIAALRRLYDENPICQTEVEFTGDVLHDACVARVGEYLAAALEVEWQEQWERSLPTWTCDCGSTFKVAKNDWRVRELYRIDDEMLGELVGTVEGKGQGAARNRDCPDCGRQFAATVARQNDPQQTLFSA